MRVQTVGKINNTLDDIAKGAAIVVEGLLLLVTDEVENDNILCVELNTGITHMIDKEEEVEEVETKIIAYTDYNTLYAERRE